MKNLSIALAQLNFTVGDLTGNKKKILSHRATKADLVVFPEMALTGYPAEDLVLRPSFQKEVKTAIQEISKAYKSGPAILFGATDVVKGKVFNAAFLINKGKVYIQHKYELPNYSVFDEKRTFTQGKLPKPLNFNGVKLGIMICEDMWGKVVPASVKSADILVSINSSPFENIKANKRNQVAKKAAANKPLIYVNQISGQDDLVFDGGSFVMSAQGKISVCLPVFQEKLVVTNWHKKSGKWVCEPAHITKEIKEEEAVYSAMVTGLRDYVNKNGFSGVVLGLSGGIDSAISAVVAVDALGVERVHGLIMPSQFTSDESIKDAEELAANLGIKIDTVSIEKPYFALKQSLAGVFSGKKEDITEENMQARVRGIMLMAFSNKFGFMVMTTGNKSEMGTGYATLYGDMCGGFSVLKDVYKTDVYKLSEWRNKNKTSWLLGPNGEVIPENSITRAPTAELRENQLDQDTLPPYDKLDDILKKLIELEMSVSDIVKTGHKKEIVEKVLKMLAVSEYKRRQAAPGVKLTAKAFGRDRRYPITNKFKM